VRIEQLGLARRVAQRFELSGADFLMVGDAQFLLGNVAGLARDRHDLKAVAFEYAAQHVGMIDETDAVRDADLAIAMRLANCTISSTRVHLQ